MNLVNIELKSFLLKSGQSFFTKKISVYDNCQSKKLLNLLVLPVLIKISGSGIFEVYKFFSMFLTFKGSFFFLLLFLMNAIFHILNHN